MHKDVESFLQSNPEWLRVIEEAMKSGFSYKVELFISDKGNIKDRQLTDVKVCYLVALFILNGYGTVD